MSEPGAHGVRDKAENIYTLSYETLLADSEQAIANLDDRTASGLLAIVSQHYSRKQ